MRIPSINRNYPFASINLVLKRAKKLIYSIKKEVLKNLNLVQLQQDSNLNSSSSKQIKLQKQIHKQSRKTTQIYDDFEKEEKPRAYYANFLPNKSAFLLYKSDSSNKKFEQQSIQTKPKIDQTKQSI